MPVIELHNVTYGAMGNLVELLRPLFPEHLEEICISRIYEQDKKVEERYAHVYGSGEVDTELVNLITTEVRKLMAVRERELLTNFPVVLYYGRNRQLIGLIERRVLIPVPWIQADTFLLSGREAPYVQIFPRNNMHGLQLRDAVIDIVDVEVCFTGGMEFTEKHS